QRRGAPPAPSAAPRAARARAGARRRPLRDRSRAAGAVPGGAAVRAPDLRPLRLRLRITYVVLLLGFAGLALRAAQLTLAGDQGQARGRRQLITALELPPERGHIVDRDGVELALTVGVPSVYAVPTEIADPAAAARALAGVLGVDEAALRRRLAERRHFVFVRRWVDEALAERVRALGLPGIGIVAE